MKRQNKIVTFDNVTFDLAEVKCLKRNGNESVAIEFKERYTYLPNEEHKN